ncbi:MAG: 4'-phosphopantetheinyl transferase superfamily protein [Gammaproteobacteria bacterium]|nr:4'-phosphopantetheinyl transferase superfamily protein [Gammaproteobacteria bacterium]
MTNFTPSSPFSIPDIHTVDIWKIPLNTTSSDISALLSILSAEELERHRQMHERVRMPYLLSHSACRNILSLYLKISPAQIQYKKSTHGKPFLSPANTLRFNMSHSNTLAVIAVSNLSEVGVDIEFSDKNTDWEKVSKRFFSAEEVQYLFKQNKADQKKVFFQLWTRKEAYIKALGTGLATSLSSFNVTAPRITTEPSALNSEASWYQKDLKIHSQYAAAVVLNTQINKIRYHSY